MRGEQLLRALEYVDAALVEEAEHSGAKKRRRPWKVLGGAAACFVLLAALSVLPWRQGAETVLPEDEDNRMPVSGQEGRARGDGAPVVVDLSGLRVFAVEDTDFAAALRYYDPERYDEVYWDRDDIVAYYGWDLTPPYIPEGFASRTRGIAATVYYEKDGPIVQDTVGRGFYHAYYDDGSPRLTDDVAALYGFSLTASRLGIAHSCYILVDEADMKSTTVNGTEVLVGYRAMPYGPYDPETHAPSGYYDVYVVQFDLDGAAYELTADQMPLREVMRITASILYGTENVVVTGVVDGVPSDGPPALSAVLRDIAAVLYSAAGVPENR